MNVWRGREIEGRDFGARVARFDPFLSLDCTGLEGTGRNPRKRRDTLLQRRVVEPQSLKPKGVNVYNLKFLLKSSDQPVWCYFRAETIWEMMCGRGRTEWTSPKSDYANHNKANAAEGREAIRTDTHRCH